MKKLLSVVVHGKYKTWDFNFVGDDKYLEEWREDGLEIEEVCYTIPVWVVNMKLTRIWCLLQDCNIIDLKL